MYVRLSVDGTGRGWRLLAGPLVCRDARGPSTALSSALRTTNFAQDDKAFGGIGVIENHFGDRGELNGECCGGEYGGAGGG
jgi:hypothetical protein